MDDQMQRRVALARDVLAQLEAKKIIPEYGTYVSASDAFCETCALGAMMVSCCGVDDADGAREDDVIECLVPLFSRRELAEIEASFEGDTGMPMQHRARYASARLRRFAEVFEGTAEHIPPEARLRAIMSNIIANDGEFVPGTL